MFNCILVSDFPVGKTDNLIQYAQCIPHAAFAFLSNDFQGSFICFNFFLITYFLQMQYGIADGYALKIKNLATAQDGGKDLVFFCCRENKNWIRRWFLQCFQEGIKSRRTEHV